MVKTCGQMPESYQDLFGVAQKSDSTSKLSYKPIKYLFVKGFYSNKAWGPANLVFHFGIELLINIAPLLMSILWFKSTI